MATVSEVLFIREKNTDLKTDFAPGKQADWLNIIFLKQSHFHLCFGYERIHIGINTICAYGTVINSVGSNMMLKLGKLDRFLLESDSIK
jgi:hypothetical protein